MPPKRMNGVKNTGSYRRRTRDFTGNDESGFQNLPSSSGETRTDMASIQRDLSVVGGNAVVKGKDEFAPKCDAKGPKKEFYISRIMRMEDDKFLAYWWSYNFTNCTWQTAEDLKGAETIMNVYREYEFGCAAILDNLQSDEWYWTQKRSKTKVGYTFQRFTVPALASLSDADLKRQMEDSDFRKKIGYWKIKKLEMEWLTILDPDLEFSFPPLYIECMTEFSDIQPPVFKFIKDYEYSDAVEEFFAQEEETSHDCPFKKPADRCDACRSHVALKLNGIKEVVVPRTLIDTTSYFIKVCTENCCQCEGGWDDCQSWLPYYCRYLPLAVVHDPRYFGWGIRAMTAIKRGQIITEYTGKVLTNEEAEEMDTSYMFGHRKLTVDSREMGNESRFFGHSCEPNMITMNVYATGFSIDRAYRCIFVAKRDIAAGENLCFDYHPHGVKPRSGYSKCRCGKDSCRGWV